MRMRGMVAAALVALVAPLGASLASAQDIAGTEDCTKTSGLDRRTGCLQANINFLQRTMTRNALEAGFEPLFQGLDADSINKLSGEIIAALQGEGGSLDLLLSTLGDLTNTLADKDQLIGDVVDNLSSVLTTVGQRDTELSNLIIELRQFVSGLAQDRNTIGNAIDGINGLATSTAGLLTQVRAPLKKDITELTGLVGNLNNDSSDVTFFVQQLAPTIGALIRTASYGSWFNFYLCDLDGEVALPGGQTLRTAGVHNGAAACNGS